MLNDPIPPHVDPRKLADRNATVEGSVPLADLKRLCDPLSDNVGAVQARFVFDRDEDGTVVIHSDLRTEVKMVCQRCLELVTLPVDSECTYAVVKVGANTQSLPSGYDVLELGEDPLDLRGVMEDELLLALPIVPAHHPEECQQPAGANEPEPGEDEVPRSNPFSVLAQLKRDPNV
ncbi:YceD family protein [Pseudomonas sp. KNUC1026]|uniref:YceD family protein n=1 Tax=Pseudomonas sp. KNUC1026 TaxID=2893890 RepID=UPI001F21B56B|nr:YceD family protein [Pseudomonas sp. KNUC1026]UFH48500.1 YceD family protein [Pseudomonas sp. KNUC1026]